MGLDKKSEGSEKFLHSFSRKHQCLYHIGIEPQMLASCSPVSSGVIVWEPLLSVQSSVTVHPRDDDIYISLDRRKVTCWYYSKSQGVIKLFDSSFVRHGYRDSTISWINYETVYLTFAEIFKQEWWTGRH